MKSGGPVDKETNAETGVLRIRLEKASGLLAADSNGSSDPFAEVSVGWSKATSSVIEQSLEPKWNEDLELRGTFGELCGSLKVALFDKDPIKWSDGLGEVTVDLEALKKRSTLKFPKQQLSTQGVVSFTVSWVKDKTPPPSEDDPRFAEESVLGTGVVNSNLPLPICLVDSHAAAFSLADATEETQGESKLVERLLPPFLILMFLLYPVVTNIAFEGFPCYTLEGGQGWLIADVTIECGASEEHAHAVLLAWLAVFLYPVGLMVLNLVLLLWAHHAIIQKKPTVLSRAIAFLYREFDVTCFWWELAEMLRKFLLVGLFVVVQPGSIMQIALGTIVCASFLMVQLQAKPYKSKTDDFLAAASSFALLMLFFCSTIYKYVELTQTRDLQAKLSDEQVEDYAVSSVVLSLILWLSVLGSIGVAGVLAVVQIAIDIRRNAQLRRLKHAETGKWVECKPLNDPRAYHLFLSHSWPAAQDRMRVLKERLGEMLPSCRAFLDVDNLKIGSGTTEVDLSECILVFCTRSYFHKMNSMKELYRAVVNRRPILAMLEPDESQDGGLGRATIEKLLTDAHLDKLRLRQKWRE